MTNRHDAIHGELRCNSTDRFTCMICWTSVCWCMGCDSDVDRAISSNRAGREGDNGGAGICDNCFVSLSTTTEEIRVEI